VDVSSDGKWVAVANYGSGSVALFPVSEKGFLQPASSVVQHTGSGPDTRRQASAHAHSISFSGHNGLIYAADLGVDRLYVYRMEPETGRLISASQPYVSLPPGSGPRHFVFSKEGSRCYVANELSSTVSVLESRENHLKLLQTVSSLPAGFIGTSYCADIHMSADGKNVYVSNRGDQSIAVFKTLEDGTLGTPVHVSTHGNWPRNFVLDPSGNFMLVANQRSHNITVFRIENGIPVFTGKEFKTPSPVCVKFL
jgi:6-phosphogluconolactonase